MGAIRKLIYILA